MKLFPPFSDLEVGEVDNFAIDFTTEVGSAVITSTAWTLALQPLQPGTDPNPESHVIELANPTSLVVRLPNNTLETLYGAFAVAQVGPCPETAAGSTYILNAQATLSDGRIIANYTTFNLVDPFA